MLTETGKRHDLEDLKILQKTYSTMSSVLRQLGRREEADEMDKKAKTSTLPISKN
jgi:hypothetical protein